MRKGNVVDILIIVIIIFVASFSMILSATFGSIVNTTMTSASTGNPNMNITHINRATTSVYGMDIVVAALFFGALLASVISAYYIGSHPFFFIFSVIFLLIIMLIASSLSNSFNDVVETSNVLSSVGSNMPYTMFMGRYLPYEALLAFVLIGVAMYAGKGGSSNSGEF